MKLRETILKEHSKANCRRIGKWVGDDQIRFVELFDLFLSDEYRVEQRAGRPLSYCVEDHPKLERYSKDNATDLKLPSYRVFKKKFGRTMKSHSGKTGVQYLKKIKSLDCDRNNNR